MPDNNPVETLVETQDSVNSGAPDAKKSLNINKTRKIVLWLAIGSMVLNYLGYQLHLAIANIELTRLDNQLPDLRNNLTKAQDKLDSDETGLKDYQDILRDDNKRLRETRQVLESEKSSIGKVLQYPADSSVCYGKKQEECVLRDVYIMEIVEQVAIDSEYTGEIETSAKNEKDQISDYQKTIKYDQELIRHNQDSMKALQGQIDLDQAVLDEGYLKNLSRRLSQSNRIGRGISKVILGVDSAIDNVFSLGKKPPMPTKTP